MLPYLLFFAPSLYLSPSPSSYLFSPLSFSPFLLLPSSLSWPSSSLFLLSFLLNFSPSLLISFFTSLHLPISPSFLLPPSLSWSFSSLLPFLLLPFFSSFSLCLPPNLLLLRPPLSFLFSVVPSSLFRSIFLPTFSFFLYPFLLPFPLLSSDFRGYLLITSVKIQPPPSVAINHAEHAHIPRLLCYYAVSHWLQ